ncbi:hypothetical protein CARUB_v10010752mg [Capsella rubella]|uniref:Secreted protein n=1 Tax=Capsella rubella TaxID=81985 RepID=R0IFX1_9BRAS|nr:hypothetical protein CARUB_v10010752mg [Capsella rubella]
MLLRPLSASPFLLLFISAISDVFVSISSSNRITSFISELLQLSKVLICSWDRLWNESDLEWPSCTSVFLDSSSVSNLSQLDNNSKSSASRGRR